MPTEEMERTLRIEIPPCNLSKGLEDLTWTDLSNLNGWRLISGIIPFWEGTIDLSGYARDYKTFYPEGGVIQEGPHFGETGCDGTVMYTIVSTTPVDFALMYTRLLLNSAQGLLDQGGLGVGRDNQNWETVMFAESQLFVADTTISPNTFGVCRTINKKQTGSLAPTASDTLYVMKIISPLSGTDPFAGSSVLDIPAARVILPGTMGQEPDLEYMMRLKRSVELANQV